MDQTLSLTEKFSAIRWVPYLLAITLFITPLSSSGKSIFLSLSILAILLTPEYRAQIARVIVKPWCLAGIALSVLTVIACLWSPSPFSKQFFEIEKYSKLLYLPLLAIGFTSAKARNISIHAFMLAMLFTCFLAILKFHGFLQAIHISPDHVFRNHIMTGFMVAFAGYLSLLMAYQQRNTKRCYLYLLLTAVYTYQILFINEGRTGYIIFLLLMMLLIVQLCSWRQAIAGMVVICSVFAFSYSVSSLFHERLNSIAEQFMGYQHNVDKEFNSALGLRLQFHDFAHSLFNQHPVFGLGTAGFTYAFHEINPVPVWRHELQEPHSQYWFVAAEFGMLGLLILGFFFYSLFKACWSLKTMRIIGIGMLVPFMIGCYSDSLLFYSGSGYFFLLFMAMCLGEEIESEQGNRELKNIG